MVFSYIREEYEISILPDIIRKSMVSDDSKGNRIPVFSSNTTAQKTKFSIKDFFSKCDKIRWKLRIWSHLLKKSLMENFIFCAVILDIPIEQTKLLSQ